MTTTTKTPVLCITIDRVEGRHEDVMKCTVGTFDEADALLTRWAQSMRSGGYDKCFVAIVWESGDVFNTRFDLSHPARRANKPLAQHVRDELVFCSGSERPAHMREDHYQSFVERIPAAKRAGMVEMLRDCAF